MKFLLDGTVIGTVDGYEASTDLQRQDMYSTASTVTTRAPHAPRADRCARTSRRPSYYGYLVWLRLLKQ